MDRPLAESTRCVESCRGAWKSGGVSDSLAFDEFEGALRLVLFGHMTLDMYHDHDGSVCRCAPPTPNFQPVTTRFFRSLPDIRTQLGINKNLVWTVTFMKRTGGEWTLQEVRPCEGDLVRLARQCLDIRGVERAQRSHSREMPCKCGHSTLRYAFLDIRCRCYCACVTASDCFPQRLPS